MTDPARALAAPAVERRLTRVGVVRAVAASSLTVEVDGAQLVLPLLAGTYAVGDSVLVLRDALAAAGGYVLGRLGAPATPPAPPPPPPVPTQPAPAERTVTLLPTSTGTWRGGAWRATAQLIQGDWSGHGLNTGAAYYGAQLAALGADLAAPRSARLAYARDRGGDYAARTPTLWLLTGTTRPAGAPTRAESAAGAGVAVGSATSWQLPAAWVDALLAGTAGGIGVHVDTSAPYVVLAGQPLDPAAFALTVTFTS